MPKRKSITPMRRRAITACISLMFLCQDVLAAPQAIHYLQLENSTLVNTSDANSTHVEPWYSRHKIYLGVGAGLAVSLGALLGYLCLRCKAREIVPVNGNDAHDPGDGGDRGFEVRPDAKPDAKQAWTTDSGAGAGGGSVMAGTTLGMLPARPVTLQALANLSPAPMQQMTPLSVRTRQSAPSVGDERTVARAIWRGRFGDVTGLPFSEAHQRIVAEPMASAPRADSSSPSGSAQAPAFSQRIAASPLAVALPGIRSPRSAGSTVMSPAAKPSAVKSPSAVKKMLEFGFPDEEDSPSLRSLSRENSEIRSE